MGCGICCTELQSNKSNAALGSVSFAPSPACGRGEGPWMALLWGARKRVGERGALAKAWIEARFDQFLGELPHLSSILSPAGRGGERKKRVLEWSGGSPALASRRLYLRDPARDERRSVNPPLPPRIHPRPVPVREAR